MCFNGSFGSLVQRFIYILLFAYLAGRLVTKLVQVPEKYVRTMAIGEKIIVDDVEVTALEANQ